MTESSQRDSRVGKPSKSLVTHPVNSTTCPECQAIGGHAPGCSATPCPSWCIDNDHSQEIDKQLDDGTGDRLHRGPRFGPLEVWATTFGDGRPTEFSIDTDGALDYATPSGLRDLAKAAEQAARWLEAQTS